MSTAAALARDLTQRLQAQHDADIRETEQFARIFIHTIVSMPNDELADQVKDPARTGVARWDAFLQALVAWRCQTNQPRIQTPDWARETHLDVGSAPFGGSIRDDGWYTLSVLSTPAVFLHCGIVLDRINLIEL